MDNPGTKNLGDVSIGAADAGSVITSGTDETGAAIAYIGDFEGAVGATLQANFNAGTPGTKVTLYYQTSLDQAQSWIDVWAPTFTTASGKKVVNLWAGTPVAPFTPTDGTLADDTVVNGIIGDRWRVKKVTTGTYSGNASISTRAVMR